MSVSQISVFTQSKPGHLARILGLFEQGGVNVRGYSVSDTGEYGIARFIVDDPDAAKSKLKEDGAAFTSCEVICAKLPDQPGQLAKTMKLLSSMDINIKYTYSMISTYIIIGVDDVEQVEACLMDSPMDLIDQEDIKRLVAEKFAEQ